jgi:murein tripeptide amidase MpaA
MVEANIHAAELTSSFAALHLIHRVLKDYGSDERVTRLLDTRTLYVVPRLNPDGAAAVLREGRYLRSSVRPYPTRTREPGLHGCDIDGDGRVLFMRVPDPDGPWKPCPDDPLLLVRRDPDEEGGDYFRLFLEGEIVDYDGATVPVAAPFEGLDLGMNFQTDWADLPEHPRGAGPFSGSEPEIYAMMRATIDRPNITGYVTCHTFGGVHLRPPMNEEEDVPGRDLRVFEEIGARAEALTGYTPMSYHDLKHEPGHVRGGQINWFYHEIGVFAWITEFWNPLRAIGTKPYHPSRWLVDHSPEEALRLIRWSNEELGGNGFVDWYPFEHPQLGRVELGGWDFINYWYNPPFPRIEGEVAPHTEWIVFQALASPRLRIRSFTSEQVSAGVYRIQLVVGNTGWLPTYVTQKALDRELCAGVTATLRLPAPAHLLGGTEAVELGQLEGRSEARTTTTWWGHRPGTPDLGMAQWLVEAPPGTTVTAVARHPRAGVARAEVRLE